MSARDDKDASVVDKVETTKKDKKEYPCLKQYFITQQVRYLTVKVQDVLKSHKTIKKYAYILHDKDDSEPHYHIYVNFGSSGVPLDTVASWFGVEPQYVEKVKGRRTDVFKYLTHSTSNSKSKYQYDPSEIVSNFNVQSEIAASNIIGNFEDYSYAQMLGFVNELPIDEKPSVFTRLKKLWELHCQTSVLKADRHIEVVFITGKSGTGKTTYAKRMLEALNYDYCVSSASNDPFQDYLGQRAIILDDLRDKSFELEDLLKMLDNNTNSSVKSRFNNKVFNGKMIVITSTVPLNYWYSWKKSYTVSHDPFDTLDQLYRRINSYVVVTKDFVHLYNGVDDRGMPGKFICEYQNDFINSVKKAPKESTDLTKIFEKITKPDEKDKTVVN